jgi:dTMP kinase
MKPLFIVFDGIDGCGKGTQTWKLAEFISSLDKHNHILLTREPYKQREIRKILRHDEKPEDNAEKILNLYVQDRSEHVSELIIPNLKRGVFVISDRYKYSTVCYQAAQGLDKEKLIAMNSGFPVPDIIFVIDASVDVAKERMKKDSGRQSEQKFERDKEFLGRVRKNYLDLKKVLPEENIILIDGNRSIEQVFEQVKKEFLAFSCSC